MLLPQVMQEVVTAGHAVVQNLRRGHYELAVDEPSSYESRSPLPSSPWPSDGVAGHQRSRQHVVTADNATAPHAGRTTRHLSAATNRVPAGQLMSLALSGR